MSRLCAAVTAFLFFLLPAAAFGAPPMDAERLAEARRMVVELAIGDLQCELAARQLERAARSEPESAPLMDWLAGQLNGAEAARRIAPVYAEYLGAAESRELRLFFSLPPGKAFWQARQDLARGGRQPALMPPGPEDARTLDRFQKSSAAWRTFNRARAQIDAGVAKAMEAWGRQLMQAQFSASGAPGQPELLPGLAALGQDIAARRSALQGRVLQRWREIELDQVLRPATLVSRAEIRAGRAKVRRAELLLGESQREMNALNEAFLQGLRQLPGFSVLRERLIQETNRQTTVAYERTLRYEENQHRILTLMRQILDFADERQERLHLVDGKLVFDDIDELRQHEALLARLRAEARIEQAIQDEEQAARKPPLPGPGSERAALPSGAETPDGAPAK